MKTGEIPKETALLLYRMLVGAKDVIEASAAVLESTDYDSPQEDLRQLLQYASENIEKVLVGVRERTEPL